MKTRKNLRAELNTLYKEKVISWLSESVNSNNKFVPVRIYLGAPAADEDMISQKDEFLKFCDEWHGDLIAGKVEFIEKTYPQIGKIEVPIHIVFESVDEIATMAGHLVEYHIALSRLTVLKDKLPELLESGIKHVNYLTSLDDADFDRFVNVCKWLCLNRDSGAFIRQIPVRGVDTIWFEKYRVFILSFLRDLFDLNPIRKDVFQLGLVPPPACIRVELIDKNIRSRFDNLRDLAIPAKDFMLLNINPRKVFIVDDLATALSFPDVDDAILIYCSNQVADICKIPCVENAEEIYYVCGIEFRSFALLNNLRVYLPKTKSVTLNREFFISNKDLWSFDDVELNELNSSMALNSEESILYNMLVAGFFGKGARLPLERISLTSIFEILGINIDDLPFKPLVDDKPNGFTDLSQNDSESTKEFISTPEVKHEDDGRTKYGKEEELFSAKDSTSDFSQERDWTSNNPLNNAIKQEYNDDKDITPALDKPENDNLKTENDGQNDLSNIKIEKNSDIDIHTNAEVKSSESDSFTDIDDNVDPFADDNNKDDKGLSSDSSKTENNTYILDILKNDFNSSSEVKKD